MSSKFATKPRAIACRQCAATFTRTSPTQIHCSVRCRILGGIKETSAGCWEWQKATVRGYGEMMMRDGKYDYTHRIAWTVFRGPIPQADGAHGTVVMHKCDNKLCCNPDHLELGTQAANVADMIRKGRHGMLGKPMPIEQRQKISATKKAQHASRKAAT